MPGTARGKIGKGTGLEWSIRSSVLDNINFEMPIRCPSRNCSLAVIYISLELKGEARFGYMNLQVTRLEMAFKAIA